MRHYAKLSLISSFLLLSPLSFASIPWSYEGATGADHWAFLSTDFKACTSGLHQSPIVIPANLPITNTNPITIDYHLNDEALKETLHSDTRFPYPINQKWVADLQHNTVEVIIKKPSSRNQLHWKDKSYQLIQFHFHSPAENQLEGQTFPLELHLVHQATDGSLAVIGVFFKEGQTNPAITKILSEAPTPEAVEKEFSQQYMHFPAEKLLPQDHHFYSFDGSLTTPPCSEPVQWFVMQQPLELSTQQLAAFKTLIGKGNARPIQARNNRQILHSNNSIVLSSAIKK